MTKLLVLFVIAFVDTVGTALVVPILPFYATRYGASAFVVSLLISAFSVAQLLSAPAWGRWSDQFGRRPAILGGLVISTVAYVVFAFADSIWLLLLSRLVQGLGGGTIGAVQAYIADASSPEERTKAIGWFTTVTSLGWISGSALGSVLVSLWGQHAPGLFTAGLSLLVAAVAWRYLTESQDSLSPEQAKAPGKPRTSVQAIKQVISRWYEPAPRLIWIYAIAIGAFYGTGAIFPLLAKDRLGTTERTIGYLIMYFAAVGVLVRARILGYLVKRLGEPRLARLGIVLLAAGLGIGAVGKNYPVLFVAFTLMPLGSAFLFPSVTGLLSKIVAQNERGVYLGVQQTFGGVGRVAFPLVAGVLMDQFGAGAPFGVAAVITLLTLPLAIALGRAPASPSPSPPS